MKSVTKNDPVEIVKYRTTRGGGREWVGLREEITKIMTTRAFNELVATICTELARNLMIPL